MSLRSPLRRVTGHGSAKGGAAHWYAQRVTAVALVLLGLWFVVSLATLGGASHERVVQWLASPIASALAVLLVLTAAYHALPADLFAAVRGYWIVADPYGDGDTCDDH